MIRLSAHLATTAILFGIVACTSSPNLIFFDAQGITAQGTIDQGNEHVFEIVIEPGQLSRNQLADLWIGFSNGRRLAFTGVTENYVRQIAKPYASTSTGEQVYLVDGYAFGFTEGQLTTFRADVYGYPPQNQTAFVMFGSQRYQTSFSLPCSTQVLETVFGRATKITQGYSE